MRLLSAGGAALGGKRQRPPVDLCPKPLWLTFPERWSRRLPLPGVCGPRLSVSDLFLPRGRKSVRAHLCVLQSLLWSESSGAFIWSWCHDPTGWIRRFSESFGRLHVLIDHLLGKVHFLETCFLFFLKLVFIFFSSFKKFFFFLFFQFYWDIIDTQQCINLRCPA